MRKLHIIIMAISCLLLTTCMKDKEITPLEINVGVWESTSDYVVIGGEYSYETELHDFYLLYDENPDFSSAESVKMDVEGKSIDAEIRDLQAETTYYYYVECKTKYSSMRTDVETFETDKGNITPDIPEEPEEPEIPGGNEIVTVNGVSFTMVAVEGGTFSMGATSEQGDDAGSDEKPVHSVTLSDYYIGETEVTQELWQAVMGNNPSYFSGSQKPVEKVSWNDCQEFITKLNQLTGKNFRLPTEAEWEYAARGGNKSQGYKYSGSNAIGNVAWTDNSSSTHDVKTKSPNELGIYDMSGNVGEWCQDWYGSYSSGSQTNPTGPSSGFNRVLRGGGWNSNARYCRVSYRGISDPGIRYSYGGFRLAL